ncbi:MAG: glycoside hydrolase family 3 C-terminal domain-containing protein [Clostridiales Family XIII bacterium]|jgi:beta-glucosidase-like glycosyl hydrolase|nr:glycoside hydrolase family 3 C-terminal domain-containing protein [Clostridiales Family XIII bacterium]
MKRKISSIALSLIMLIATIPGGAPVLAIPADGNIALSRAVAAEGMVLLENDGVLPLRAGAKVSMFGSGQVNFIKGGTGSGDVNVDYVVNMLAGMRNKAAEGKIVLDAATAAKYEASAGFALTQADVEAARAVSDVAVIVISRNSGEGSDRAASKGDYYMSDAEIAMVSMVSAAFDNVVVVMNVGGVVDMTWTEAFPSIKAALLAGQPGMEGGNAVADVLCGDSYPSGKLVDTYARSYSDYPSSSHFGTTAVEYYEDIFVGYRWFSTADPAYSKVKYEFGYGKSYTTFAIDQESVTIEGDEIRVSARVTNTGARVGKEVVQAYFRAPDKELIKPARELAAFAKTRELRPGESQTLEMKFKKSDMASYDEYGKTGNTSAYVLEAGEYSFYVGNSVKDAKPAGAYTQAETVVTQQLAAALEPMQQFERLVDPATGETEMIGPEPLPPPDVIHSVSGTSSTTIQAAEPYTRTGGIVFETVPATGRPCIAFFNNGEELVYQLDVEKAGTYDIVVNYALGRASIADAMDILVNNALQPGIRFAMAQTGDGNNNGEWYNPADSAVYKISLPEGLCLLKFRSKSSAGNLNYFTLSPEGPAPVSPEAYAAAGAGYAAALDAAADYVTGVVAALDDAAPGDGGDVAAAPGDGDDAAPAPGGGGYVPSLPYKLSDVYYGYVSMYDFVDQMSNAELADLSQGHSGALGGGTGIIGGIAKYGAPGMETADGPAGLRISSRATAWPIGTMIASTWNTELVEAIGNAVGVEALLNGVDIWLAPGMNIHRNPRCGRNFEYYSEDPLVTGKIAAAITKGVQANGVGVTVKHYAANNQETNRSSSNTIASERALREIYLEGFRIAVEEAQPWCVMTSYNLINGTETAESYDLVSTILRDEWGFEGLVMTDWSNNNSTHYKEAIAGNDIKMPNGSVSNLTAALESGDLERGALVRNISRIMEVTMKSQPFLRTLKTHAIGEGVTRVEAEYYSDVAGTPKPQATSDVGGGFNMGYLDAGGSISYRIDVQEAGDYDVSFRTAGEGVGRYGLSVDGVSVGNVTTRHTGAWQNWTTLDPVTVSLPAGEHIFKIDILASGGNINWFEFNSEKTPLAYKQILPIGATRVEAEDCYEVQGSARPEATSDVGGGQNMGYLDAGNGMSYRIAVDKAGDYELRFRTAGTGTARYALSVDGAGVGTATTRNTGGWQNWTTIDPVTVSLPAGEHIFKIDIAAGGSNLNWFEFDAGTGAFAVAADKPSKALTVTGEGYAPGQSIELAVAYNRAPAYNDSDYRAFVEADGSGAVSVAIPASVTAGSPWLGGHRYYVSLNGKAEYAPIETTVLKIIAPVRLTKRVSEKGFKLDWQTDAAEYRFTSSNNSVASVDQEGNVKLLRAGTAVLTLRDAGDSGMSSTVMLSVSW